MPPIQTIAGAHLPIDEQKWKRTELPSFRAIDIDWFSNDQPEDPYTEISWEEARREEIIKQTGTDPENRDRSGNPRQVPGVEADPDYFMEALEDFRVQEFDRIFNGYWFFNKGVPTYVNGMYYFYLNWWKMDVGYPHYREPDKELFYVLEVCDIDPRCFGLLYITMRGVGKSFIAGMLAYYFTITNQKAHIGIQSKTDEDAEELFLTKIAEPYKDLPDFLVPINKHGTNPTRGLNFSPQTTTGKKASLSRRLQREALRSKLDYKNAGEKAYDGTTLRFLLQDEVGKVEERVANVKKRWLVNRQCVWRDNRKRGIAFLTTTVEEMDKGGEPCKQIWYDSDINERNENGRTKSWLYRYFRSALDTTYFDEYGFPDRDKAKIFHDAERKALENDPTALISYIQKNPYTIEEAFMTQGEGCIYNAAILQERQVSLSDPNFKGVRKGEFKWYNNVVDGKVEWVDNPINRMWEISFMQIPDDEQNSKQFSFEAKDVKYWKPGPKKGKRFIGYDPYSHEKVALSDSSKKSDAAAIVYQKFDFHIPEEHCNTIIADFAGRYHTPAEAHEQVIMAAIFFNAEILPESNKFGAIEHITKRGYRHFIMDRPSASGSAVKKRQPGMPSNRNTITYYTELTRNDINDNGHKLKHLRVVKDWLEFDPTNTTKFDSGVAASYAIVAAQKPTEEYNNSIVVSNIFRTFDHSSDTGKIN
jgi:hypothetical protein